MFDYGKYYVNLNAYFKALTELTETFDFINTNYIPESHAGQIEEIENISNALLDECQTMLNLLKTKLIHDFDLIPDYFKQN